MSSKEEKPEWLESVYDTKYAENIKNEEETPLFGSGKAPLYDSPAKETDQETCDNKNDALDVEEGSSVAGKTQASKSTEASATSKEDSSLPMPHRPRENPCLWLFHLLQGVAVLASLGLLVTQILPLFLVKTKDIPARIGVLSLALKFYLSLFCFLFVLVEADLPVPFVRSSQLLQTYFSRGFIYSFIGLICVEEAYSERVKDIVSHGSHDQFHVGWAAIFMQISSWLMLGVGIVYMLLGIFCLRLLRDKLQQKEKDDWKQYREDLKEWKKRRRALGLD